VCAADGCDQRLRKDNRIGFCDDHRTAKAREPARFCAAPGCDRTLRTDNTTGYCSDHVEPMWKDREYLDRRYARERAERAQRPDVRRTCSVDGCDRKLRSDNTSGRCVDHIYIPLDLPVCSVDGCGKRLKSGNALGRCMEHCGLYWGDDPPKCGEPDCGKALYRDNRTGFCHKHRKDYNQAYMRAYYERNQADLREYARQYREVYAEEHRAYASAWNASNREARFASNARRRLVAATGMDAIDRMLSVSYRLALRNDPCFYCGSPVATHVDHYFPLAKGGSGHWWNLVKSCDRCNNAKYVMCGTAFLLLSGG
jgi:5-methylcytosine-specific restriction endonuclease McrA